jgi:outer membrane protein, multidrug efflux system
MKLFFSIFLTSSVIVGCGFNSSITGKQLSLPKAWKNAGNFPVASPSNDLSRWWSRFEDPTLNHIISRALINNPNIAIALARIKESRARKNAETASLFPSLTGAISAGKRNDFIGNSNNSYTAGLNVSWETDLFGKRRSSVEAASARLGASEENFHSIQASLASEIAITYTNLRVTQATLEVLQRTVKTRSETSQLASWRNQSGEADSLESSQASSSLEQARSTIPALEQSIAQSKNSLALLTGQFPGTLDSLLSSGKKLIPNPANSLAINIPADTLRQRPDVRIAGYQILAAAANSSSAKAELYPSINLSGSLGLNALRSGKLFNAESASAGIISGISGPIFDAGRIRSNILEQNAVEEQAIENYRATVLTALSEVENSLIACRRTSEQLKISEKATSLAREAATIAQQRYQAGVIDILTVLDAQRTLLSLENNLFSIKANRTIAYIQLYKAFGGGW